VQADLVPDEYIAEGIMTALLRDAEQRGTSLIGQRILLALAAEARKVLITDLQQAGALVDEVAVYYTLPVASNDAQGQEVLRLLRNHQLDIVTFTSSSTVRNFVAWLHREVEQLRREGASSLPPEGTDDTGTTLTVPDSPLSLLRGTRIASIGPITSQTARQLGLHVDIEATEFTMAGLVDAIIKYKEIAW